MNVADTLRALALAAQYDPRMLPVGDDEQTAKAAAWSHALDVRMDPQWALVTVAAIYAEQPGVMLTPAHLNRRFLAMVRQPHEQGGAPRLPHPPAEPDRPKVELPAVGSGVGPTDEQRARMRSGESSMSKERRDSLAVPCPHCGAQKGEVCTVRGRVMRAGPAHPSRLALV